MCLRRADHCVLQSDGGLMRNTCHAEEGITSHRDTYCAHIFLKWINSFICDCAYWWDFLLGFDSSLSTRTFLTCHAFHCLLSHSAKPCYPKGLAVLIKWSKYIVISVKHMAIESALSPRSGILPSLYWVCPAYLLWQNILSEQILFIVLQLQFCLWCCKSAHIVSTCFFCLSHITDNLFVFNVLNLSCSNTPTHCHKS